MTASGLRYLIPVHELCKNFPNAKLTMVVSRMQVSKADAFKAVERLESGGYVYHEGKQIMLTEKGKDELDEYILALQFIESHLECHCGTSKDWAYRGALSALCTFSDVSRKGIAK